MAPLRSQRAAARAQRNQPDTDVLSGMPVRQYMETSVTVNSAPPKPVRGQPKKDTIWAPLPMPKGSEMYPQHAQLLLRQARMPYIPPEDRDDPEEGEEDGDGEDAESFTVKKWVLVPQGQERPEKKLLADRPKSLPALNAGTPGQPRMRKVKVKRQDVNGNENVFDVLVPEGVHVEGEVAPAEAPAITAEPIAPGTVVEGVGVANEEGVVVVETTPQPNRRKPPPPKRKKHGPGRGKKRVMLEAPGADGSMETTEAATPSRTDGDDGDDDDDHGDDDDNREDGEFSEEAGTPIPVPNGGGLPDPPRSVPTSVPAANSLPVTEAPAIVVETEKEAPQVAYPDIQDTEMSVDPVEPQPVDTAMEISHDPIPTPVEPQVPPEPAPLEQEKEPTPPATITATTTTEIEPPATLEPAAEKPPETEPAATSSEATIENEALPTPLPSEPPLPPPEPTPSLSAEILAAPVTTAEDPAVAETPAEPEALVDPAPDPAPESAPTPAEPVATKLEPEPEPKPEPEPEPELEPEPEPEPKSESTPVPLQPAETQAPSLDEPAPTDSKPTEPKMEDAPSASASAPAQMPNNNDPNAPSAGFAGSQPPDRTAAEDKPAVPPSGDAEVPPQSSSAAASVSEPKQEDSEANADPILRSEIQPAGAPKIEDGGPHEDIEETAAPDVSDVPPPASIESVEEKFEAQEGPIEDKPRPSVVKEDEKEHQDIVPGNGDLPDGGEA